MTNYVISNCEILRFFNIFLEETDSKFCEDFYNILKNWQARSGEVWIKDLVLLVDKFNAINRVKSRKNV